MILDTPVHEAVHGEFINQPVAFQGHRLVSQAWAHFLIAGSITLFAFLLLSKGWSTMKTALQRRPLLNPPPEQVIQLSNMPDPVNLANPLAPLFTPEVQQWSDEIIRWSADYDLDPNFVATVMQIESCGHPEVVSGAGAIGLFQVMPYHFQHGEDPNFPDTNALRGLQYLHRSLQIANGNIVLALAGYNGGHGVINRSNSEWPDETIRYAYWGSGIYQDAQKHRSSSDRLDEWLQAGGASLCAISNNFAAGKE